MPPVPVDAINVTSFNASQFGPACAQQAVCLEDLIGLRDSTD